MRGQVLVFDADDTLWENNHLFERVIDDYLHWLAHPTMSAGEIRAVLLDIEAANAAAHGYGSDVFLRSLRDCFGHLNERPATDDEHAAIDALARPLLEHRGGTRARGRRHAHRARHPSPAAAAHEGRTRGAAAQDRRVGARTPLRGTSTSSPRRTSATYEWLLREHDLPADSSWMIGNSPKSDIVPARAAGLRAVYIPNANTWALEHTELDADDAGILHLRRITELLDHF